MRVQGLNSSLTGSTIVSTVGALVIRIGFGGVVYCDYNYNKEPPN